MSARLSVTLPRVRQRSVTESEPDTSNAVELSRCRTQPRSAATSLLPLRFVCFLVFHPPPPPERSCFTKRLVNISVRTRQKRGERRGEEGEWRDDKRQEKTICASVVSASSVWGGKGPLCSSHNEERRLGGRKQRSLPFAFFFFCLVFISLGITHSGGRGGGRRGEKDGGEEVVDVW